MTRAQAGSMGGRATVAKHGRAHMANIGRRGAQVTWTRYTLYPAGTSAWAMVDKATGKVKAVIGSLPVPITSTKPSIDNMGQ